MDGTMIRASPPNIDPAKRGHPKKDKWLFNHYFCGDVSFNQLMDKGIYIY